MKEEGKEDRPLVAVELADEEVVVAAEEGVATSELNTGASSDVRRPARPSA